MLFFSQDQSVIIFKNYLDTTYAPYVYIFDKDSNYLGATDKFGKAIIKYKGKVFVKSFLYKDTSINVLQNNDVVYLKPRVNVLHEVYVKPKVRPCKILVNKTLFFRKQMWDTTVFYRIKYSTLVNDWEENFSATIKIIYKHKKIKNIIVCDYQYNTVRELPDSIYNSLVLFLWKKSLFKIGPFLNKHKLKKICSNTSVSFNHKQDTISVLVEKRGELFYEFFSYNFANDNLYVNGYGYNNRIFKLMGNYYDNYSIYYGENFENSGNIVLLKNAYGRIRYTLHFKDSDTSFYAASSVELEQINVKPQKMKCKGLKMYALKPRDLYEVLNLKVQ